MKLSRGNFSILKESLNNIKIKYHAERPTVSFLDRASLKQRFGRHEGRGVPLSAGARTSVSTTTPHIHVPGRAANSSGYISRKLFPTAKAVGKYYKISL
jgi:hypothetical protein